jgi:hypothetical protein
MCCGTALQHTCWKTEWECGGEYIDIEEMKWGDEETSDKASENQQE